MPKKNKTRRTHKAVKHIVLQRKEGKMPQIKHTHKKYRDLHAENEKLRRKQRKQIAHERRTQVEEEQVLHRPRTPDGPPPNWPPKEDSLEKLMKQMSTMKIKKQTKKGGKSSRKTRKQIARRIARKHKRKNAASKHAKTMRK